MKDVTWSLSAEDYERAEVRGRDIAETSERNRTKGRFGAKDTTKANLAKAVIQDIEACATEICVSQFTGLPWIDGGPGRPDVGDDIDVKHRKRAWWDLILQPNTRDKINTHLDWRYVLVTGEKGLYLIRGWIYGYEMDTVPLSDPYNTKRPTHWIKQRDLRHFNIGPDGPRIGVSILGATRYPNLKRFGRLDDIDVRRFCVPA